MKRIEQAVDDFINNEDLDQGNEHLRHAVTTIKELRYAIAYALQNCEDHDYEDVKDCLISVN